MIIFDVKCEFGHVFEGWFASGRAFRVQCREGDIECPVCGSRTVAKAITAPNVGAKGNRSSAPVPVASENEAVAGTEYSESVGMTDLPPALENELHKVLTKVQDHVEKTCDYVGKDFPEEARKIHYGETPERGIYGEATVEESEELIEEGIDIMALPLVRKPRAFDS